MPQGLDKVVERARLDELKKIRGAGVSISKLY